MADTEGLSRARRFLLHSELKSCIGNDVLPAVRQAALHATSMVEFLHHKTHSYFII